MNSVSYALLLAFLVSVESGNTTQAWTFEDLKDELFSKARKVLRIEKLKAEIDDPFQSGSQVVNKWNSYHDWPCNAPQVDRHGTAAFFASNDGVESLFRVLVYGGKPRQRTLGLFRIVFNTTWIYYEETNSWRIVNNPPAGPPGLRSLSLVTLCNEYVILLHPDLRNDTWKFLVKTEEWKRVAVVGEVPPRTYFQNHQAVPLAVRDVNSASSCCSEAVILFPCGFRTDLSTQYEFSCNSDCNTYAWTSKSAKLLGPASQAECLSFVTSKSKELVMAVVVGCLWQYSVPTSTWTPTSSCSQVMKFSAGLLNYAVALVEDPLQYLIYNMSGGVITRISMSNLPYSSERIVGYAPDIFHIYSMRWLTRNKALVYLTEHQNSCGSSKWILETENASEIWVWTKLSMTSKLPLVTYRTMLSFYHRNFYLLQEDVKGDGADREYLWSLDLSTMMWQGLRRFKESSIRPEYKSKSVWLDNDILLVLSSFMSKVIKSLKQIYKGVHPMTQRIDFSLVTVNSTMALLFGGRSKVNNFTIFNELWSFSPNGSEWVEMKLENHPKHIPSPRYGHAASVVDSKMFIYGGRNSSNICYEDLWRLDLAEGKWMVVNAVNRGPRLVHLQPCVTNAASQAGQIWIAIGCSDTTVLYTCESSNYQLWMFIVHLQMWELVTEYRTGRIGQGINNPFLYLTVWRGYLLRLDPLYMRLFYMKLGCPRGLSSRNISDFPCDVCKIGSYADRETQLCLQCPSGTTTARQRSTTINDCTVCARGYCQNGHCLVVTNHSMPFPACQCYIGFTGSRCQYATYYYIGLGVVMFVVAMVSALILIWYIRRKKKLHEKMLRQQIEQLNNVWQINWEEVTMQEEIGSGASGRVSRAQYRDMTVAVKMLRVDDDPQMLLEFAREIKFMQTMRHRNIILFLGAGRSSQHGQPFFVTEFTRNGSLRQVLDDDSIELASQRKIGFSLDAAKGISFLHNLDPPRIHRDLKSDNLLVSESWVVKVADFGLGRPFHSESIRKRLRETKRSLANYRSVTEPLLEMREGVSLDGIGTARWIAPELSRRQIYDGSVDVYSFGIVLWEIWTRDFPFRQYRFDHAVIDAVNRGERPPVPKNCPVSYANVMQACWSNSPLARPSFNNVVSTLEIMNGNHE